MKERERHRHQQKREFKDFRCFFWENDAPRGAIRENESARQKEDEKDDKLFLLFNVFRFCFCLSLVLYILVSV